jgi:hypothetical protein
MDKPSNTQREGLTFSAFRYKYPCIACVVSGLLGRDVSYLRSLHCSKNRGVWYLTLKSLLRDQADVSDVLKAYLLFERVLGICLRRSFIKSQALIFLPNWPYDSYAQQ